MLLALLALLALGKCPRETTVVPTPTMVAKTGQRRATSLRLAALPITTKLAYEHPNTRLVPRTSNAREPRCWLYWCHWLCYLPLGNCPGETAVVPTPTKVMRTGQHRASSWLLALLAALPITTTWAYGAPTHTVGPSNFKCL